MDPGTCIREAKMATGNPKAIARIAAGIASAAVSSRRPAFLASVIDAQPSKEKRGRMQGSKGTIEPQKNSNKAAALQAEVERDNWRVITEEKSL